jgi:flavin-dependent dehydrogenase
MGLWQGFLAQGHAPCQGGQSVWGGAEPVERDALRDPDGPGWHLDRGRFDRWLRNEAMARGAALVTPAQALIATRAPGGWRLNLDVNGRQVSVHARFLVDASGRGAALARQLGARRTVSDRLACGWLHGEDRAERQAGLTHIEAEPDGWWYTAPLPGNRRVVAFHTDADLPAASAAHSREALSSRLERLGFFAAILESSGFIPSGPNGFCAAHGSVLTPAAGHDWLAAGDAATGFDPLASQGLFNAIYTGLAAAETADRHLSGSTEALRGYAERIRSIHLAYNDHLRAWYGLERRWPNRPFWSRRHIPRSGGGATLVNEKRFRQSAPDQS